MSLTKVSYSMIAGASVNVLDYGAVGNGSTDDTSAVNAAIGALGANGQLVFPAGFNFAVQRLEFDNMDDFSVLIEGKITNIAAKAGGTATDVNTAERGLKATFYITNCNRFKIYGSGQINNGYREAFCIGEYLPTNVAAPCSNFEISIDVYGNGTNDNIHCNRIRYCTNFAFCNMTMNAIGKKPAYVNNSTAYYYSWVESLLIWDCSSFTIDGVTVTASAMNGIYVGSNNTNFTIANCDLEHNGASAVQLAWSSFGSFPSDFNITNNRTKFNRADGIDVNNTGTLLDAFGVISGNQHYYNGWGTEDTAATTPTNDGSGIGTFINIKKITVTDNTANECSRAGIYLVFCFDMQISGNIVNKNASATLGEGIYVQECTNISVGPGNYINIKDTLPAYKLFTSGGTGNTNVRANGNYFAGRVEFAGGTYVDSEFNGNKVVTTTAISIPVNASDNIILVSGAGQNGLFANASGITLDNNRVTANNYAIVVDALTGVVISNSNAVGQNGGVYLNNAEYCRVTTTYGSGQAAPGIQFNGVCNFCEISLNRGASVSGNSLRVESTCTNTQKWANKAVSGATSFAGTYGINF
jgi:parallel beta-helix repeat protein